MVKVKRKYKIEIPISGSKIVEQQDGTLWVSLDANFIPIHKKGKIMQLSVCEIIDNTIFEYLDSENESIIRDLLKNKINNLLSGVQRAYFKIEEPQSLLDQETLQSFNYVFRELMPGFLEKWAKGAEKLIDKIILKMNRKNKNLETNKEETKEIMFSNPPHVIGDREIWTYTQFKINILKTSPEDFLRERVDNDGRKIFINDIPRLTYLASFVERYLKEDDEEPGVSHLKEILELLSEDLKKYQPLFYDRIKNYLDSEILEQATEPIISEEKPESTIEKVFDFMNALPEIIEKFENSSAFNNPKKKEDWKIRVKSNIDNLMSMIIGFLSEHKSKLTGESVSELSWRIKMLVDAKSELDYDNRVAERIEEEATEMSSEKNPDLVEYIRNNYNFDKEKIFKGIMEGEKDIKKPSIFKNIKVDQEVPEKSTSTFKHLGKGLTLKEALKHSLSTRDSNKVRCKKCKGIYSKRHFYGHYKKHMV